MADVTPPRAAVLLALTARSGFEVLTEDEKQQQLRITGRSYPNQWNLFLPVIAKLLTVGDDASVPWTCDISKQYVLHRGKVAYSWRLIFRSENGIVGQYASIAGAINAAPRPQRVELTEALLPGYKAGDIRPGVNAKGKGASTAGSAPMILDRRR